MPPDKQFHRENLRRYYYGEKMTVAEIAHKYGCSPSKVIYWMKKHHIPRRGVSDALYLYHNPTGDPFCFTPPRTLEEAKLFGIGIGLYWGEGTKASRTAIRLGNSDPLLIRIFCDFLVYFFRIKDKDLKFGLQIFSDVNVEKALAFWTKNLRMDERQFYKPIVTRSGKVGTYRKKRPYGVVTVYYHNRKLRELFDALLPK